MEIVTGSTGRVHVTPIDDAVRNGNVGYLNDRVVFDVYESSSESDNFKATVRTNNLVRIGRGYGMNQGRLFKILNGSYDEVTIENGQSGLKRADLIVARYEMNAITGVESIELAVIRGAAGTNYVDPAYTTGDITRGDTEDEFPLYRVKINGLQIEECEQLFTLVPDGGRVGIIEKKLEASFITDLASENEGYLNDEGTEIGVKGVLPITHGGTGSNAAVGARDNLGLKALATKDKAALGSDVSGTLPVSNGGTGKASVTSGKALVGNGTNALQEWNIDTTPNTGHNQALITSKAVADAIGQAGYGDMLKSTYDSDNDGAIDVAAGGTGATDAAAARTNLGAASATDLASLTDDLGDFEESITGKVSSNAPYLFRKSKGNLVDLVLEGYSLPVNQIQSFDASKTDRGVTATFNSSTGVVSLSNSTTTSYTVIFPEIYVIKGHKYLLRTNLLTNPNNLTFRIGSLNTTLNMTVSGTGLQEVTLDYNGASDQTRTSSSGIQDVSANTDLSGITFQFNIVDITQEFGTDIADHIYSKEQASAGSGIEWIKSFGFFSKFYEPFNLGSIQSVKTSGRKVVGFNIFDKNHATSAGNYILNDNGQQVSDSTSSYFLEKIKVIPGETYFFFGSGMQRIYFFDEAGNFISRTAIIPGYDTQTMPSNCHYISLQYSKAYLIINEWRINISDTAKNGIYEPYQSETYPINTELRGILKRDGDNLYAYGDTDIGVGNIGRKFIEPLDLGTLDWTYVSGEHSRFTAANSTLKKMSSDTEIANVVCTKYIANSTNSIYNHTTDKTIGIHIRDNDKIWVYDSAYSDAATFKAAMSGVYITAEANTPTTETTTPWQNPQRAYLDGTEEFIDNRDVPLPVGNNSVYQLNETLPPIEDYVDGAVKNINYRQPDIEYTLQTGEVLYTAITNMHIDDKKITPFAMLVLEDTHGDIKEHILHYARKSVTSGTMLILFREFPMIGITPPYIAGITLALRKELEDIYIPEVSCDYCLELGFSISNSGGDVDIDIVQNMITLQAGDVVKFYY